MRAARSDVLQKKLVPLRTDPAEPPRLGHVPPCQEKNDKRSGVCYGAHVAVLDSALLPILLSGLALGVAIASLLGAARRGRKAAEANSIILMIDGIEIRIDDGMTRDQLVSALKKAIRDGRHNQ